MADQTYDDILDRSFDELQDDKILPLGTWNLRLRNTHFKQPSTEGQSAQVLFFYHPIEPTGDVDVEAMEALGENYDYTENQIVFKVWIEGNRSWRDLMNHLKKHIGIDWTAGSIREVLKKGCKGAEVMAELGERTYENNFGELVVENVPSNFRPME